MGGLVRVELHRAAAFCQGRRQGKRCVRPRIDGRQLIGQRYTGEVANFPLSTIQHQLLSFSTKSPAQANPPRPRRLRQ